MKRFLQDRFGGVFLVLCIFLMISTVIRIVLMVSSLAEIDLNLGILVKIYSVGLFYDFIAAFYFASPYVVYLMLVPDRVYRHKYQRYFSYTIFFAAIYLLLFAGVAEWTFWNEYGARFNFIAVDYLVYTNEVIGSIRESYPVPSLLFLIFIPATIIFCFIISNNLLTLSFEAQSTLKERLIKGTGFLLLPGLCFALVDQSFATISDNNYHNELAKNGIYSLFYAFRSNRLDYETFYLTKDDRENFIRLRRLLKTENSEFISDDPYDISRLVTYEGPEKKYNIILVAVESLSSAYLGVLGNPNGLTPCIDTIAREGMLFTNFHATGTRTVRGLEAITLSTVPTPGRSIVKRPHNENLFSAGFIFRDRGYDTKFIYGGYGYFDNMDYFFEQNGFDVVDRTDLGDDEKTFTNVWGVCDEDILRRTIKEADRSYQAGKPFFNFVMTTSNHRPFTYPEGKIDIPSHSGRKGGVKYTDYSIGEFIKAAHTKPWFNTTIIVIVADHCGSSAGKIGLPVKKYEIPLIIYNPYLFKPRKIDKLCSQIDLMPTLFGILNWSYYSKFMGKDIFRMMPEEERAFIGNYQKLGLLKNDKLGILEPFQTCSFYKFDRKSGKTKRINEDQSFLLDMIAYYQSAHHLFKKHLNQR